MTARIYVFGLLICISIIACAGESDGILQSRYRRLVRRYLSNAKARTSMVSTPGKTWLCRRGKAIAVCGSDKTYQRRPGLIQRRISLAKPRRNAVTFDIGNPVECRNSTCKHGNCISGSCVCIKGWYGKRCSIDVNECARRTHSCEHKCSNRRGGYKCYCRRGYKLHRDRKHCVARRRKSTTVGPAALLARTPLITSRRRGVPTTSRLSLSNATSPYTNFYQRMQRLYYKRRKANACKTGCRYKCTHSNGVEKCTCPEGFSLASDQRSCIDVNECLDIGNGKCPSSNQECVNTYGSYTCKCRIGYVMIRTLYGKQCRDANECLNGDNKCGPTAKCINSVGSYVCECENGLLKATNNRDCVPVGDENFVAGVVNPPVIDFDDIQ